MTLSAGEGGGWRGVSPGMTLATLFVRSRGKPLAHPDRFRRATLGRTYPEAASIPKPMATRYAVDEEWVEGRRVITVAPKSGGSQWRIVYTHGGAYVNALTKPHWDIVEALIQATGATVIVPLYPLAPEFDNRAAYAFLTQVYQRLLKTTSPRRIALMGDSAGAGLALGQALVYRDQGLPLPSRILLLSPWLDLELANPATRAVEPRDPMLSIDALRLCGIWWAGRDNLSLPRLSPLHAELGGLPPIDVFQGARDIFVVDARQFAKRARDEARAVRYFEFPGAFHVFMAATFTREAKAVFRMIGTALSD